MNLRVFVSSTFMDLKDHRAAILAVLERRESRTHAMEYFGSRPDAPKDVCIGEVRKAHVFILVLGMRYGAVDEDSGLSFTHLEYLEAVRLSMPILVYVIDEAKHLVLPKDVDVGEGGIKLRTLKSTVMKSHAVSFFESPSDLAAKILCDLPALVEREKIGIESRELESIVAKLPRLTWLNEDRLEFLLSKLGELASPFKRKLVLKEVLEFLLLGDRHSAMFLTAKHTGLDLRASIDLCMQIHKVLASVLELGFSRLEADRANKSLQPTATAVMPPAGQEARRP